MDNKGGGRHGLSAGTWAMLAITLIVIAGCVALFPTLTGDVDVRVSPDEIAKALGDNIRSVTQAMTGGDVAPRAVSPNNTALPTGYGEYTAYTTENAPVITATPAPTPVPTPEPKRSFTLTATGKITINRAMQKAMMGDKNRFSELLKYVSSELKGDMTLATLAHTAVSSEDAGDTNLPVSILPELRSSGLDTLCVAFGGTLSFGLSGARTTLDTLKTYGFTAYGAYTTEQERQSPVIAELRGVKVALLSYCDELTSASKKNSTKEERAYAFPAVDIEEIKKDIASARAQGAKVIVASLCWGKPTATSVTKAQQSLAYEIAKAGADVILGTNSAAVLPMEMISTTREDGKTHDTLVAYSLGSLVTPSRDKRIELSGVILHLTIEYDPATGLCAFDKMTYAPTYVWRAKEDGAYMYRVVQSDQPKPETMDKDQNSVMEKCLAVIEKVMQDAPLTRR